MHVPTPERWSWLAGQTEGLRRSLRGRFHADEADDIAQEAILKAATALSVSDTAPSTAWLQRIARNVGIDRWRRRRRVVRLDAAAHIAIEHVGSAAQIDIERALRTLRRSDRDLLTQVAAGTRYAEIADGQRVSAEVVRQRVARARARLLTALEEGA